MSGDIDSREQSTSRSIIFQLSTITFLNCRLFLGCQDQLFETVKLFFDCRGQYLASNQDPRLVSNLKYTVTF